MNNDTTDKLAQRLREYERDERHKNAAETGYWCKKYRQLAAVAIEALAAIAREKAEPVAEVVEEDVQAGIKHRFGAITCAVMLPIGTKLYTHPTAPAEAKADGYAVLINDKASAPHGYWFAGLYHDKETADLLAAKNGKCDVREMIFVTQPLM